MFSNYNPEFASGRRDDILAQAKMEFAKLEKMLENFPDDQLYTYRPHPQLKTGAELFHHIMDAIPFFTMAAALGEFKFDGPPPEPQVPATKQALAGFMRQAQDDLLASVSGFSGEQLAKHVPFFGGPAMAAVEYVNWHLNHLVHHRGQLVVYLRQVGGKVPAIYGGSADEPMSM